MRRSALVLFALVASLGVVGISSATPVPESQENCRVDDNAGPVAVDAIQSGQAATVTICNDDADFPLEGNITVNADAENMCGDASIDGDPENPYLDFDQDGAGNLDGYAALEVDGTNVGIEETEQGDYRSDCV
ncbi:MAG TPA: hypothetical protein VGB64_06205 [Actinomycetota bacterium]